MQTARVTILMSPDKKAAFDALAAERGVSTGEFFRQAGDRAARTPEEQEEEELVRLTREVGAFVPEMAASLDRSLAILRESRAEIDAMLREAGLRA